MAHDRLHPVSGGGEAGRRIRGDDGWVGIEDYAALGDGRTVALVARDGRIDWWPVPTIDAPPAFAAVLDPGRGGHLALEPEGDYEVERRYVPGTNVLESTFRTGAGVVRVTDALAVGMSGPLPWGELLRRVEGLEGEVTLHWDVVPGSRFGSARAWTEQPSAGSDRATTLLHLGDQHLGVRCFDLGEVQVLHDRVRGRLSIGPGSSGLLAVTVSDREPVFLPERDELERHLDRTCARWQEWSDALELPSRWSDAVRRSALALKLLLYTPTGAIAAAPTTSLPERIGGPRNWDYRYMWVRDASFTVDALMELRLHEEVQGAVSWLIDVVRSTAPDLQVFYTLDGDVPGGQEELDAPGYRNSRPVRSGNGAAGQSQLGTFGDLFDTIWHYVRRGHRLDPPTGRLLADLADRTCDIWQRRDSGIWELHQREHYTISKMGCWVALDRASRMADAGAIATGHADRWRDERDAVKRWVDEHCWSPTKRSYTFYAGTDDLDAATLLMGQTGFDRGERLAGTVAAVREELADGPLVHRYTGMRGQEGAFLACSFWLVSALVSLGRTDEAAALMDSATALTNDVGLLSEEMEVGSRAMLGNFPQGLSHLALINAAFAWDHAVAS